MQSCKQKVFVRAFKMGNNIQSSASCPSNPSHKMSGTSKIHNRGPPIISMNSVEESASPTKALDHDSDNLSKSSTHYHCAQCLKITEKVSFNIASEASYVYILSGQKFIKKAKNGQFWRVFENATFLVIFKHCERGGFDACSRCREAG